MAFVVKLPFTRPKKEEKACTNCSFTTRNDVLFQRHIKLCGATSLTKSSLQVKSISTQKKGQNKPASGPSPGMSRQYNRNYICEFKDCNFTTFKPRLFLQHRAQLHGEKLSIWQCDRCEYASKYRHKLERHTRLVHRSNVINAVEEVVSQAQKSKRKPTFVTRIRRDSGGQQQRGIPTSVDETQDVSQPSAVPSVPDPSANAVSRQCDDLITDLSIEGVEKYTCKACGYTSESHVDLEEHVKETHSNTRQYKCDLCQFTGFSKQEYTSHRATHSNVQSLFTCAECEYTTETRRNFDRHMASHSKVDGTHKCFYCSFTSSTEAAVHRHMGQYHKSKGPAAYMVTKPVATPTKPIENDVEKDAAEQLEQMTVDQPENNDSQFTEDRFVQEGNDVDHVTGDEDMEEDEDDDDEVTAGPGELVCGECGFEARRMKTLLKHLDSHVNPDVSEVKASEPVQKTKKIILEVPTIKPIFNKRPAVDDGPAEIVAKRARSVSEEPVSSSERQSPVDSQLSLQCSYCSYIAKWPSDLRRHLKVHSVDRRFSCQFCGKMYKYNGDLNVHMKKAHPDEFNALDRKEKVYKCPLCDYSTISKKMYSAHFEVHTGVEFKCVYCAEKHQIYQNIKTHLEYQHAEELSMETIMLEDVIDRCLDADVPSSKESTPMKTGSPVETVESDGSLEKNQIAPGKWKCPKCAYLTHAQSKLRAHIATHDNIKPFQCPDCGKRSNWKWDVVKHMRSVHPTSTKQVIQLSLQEAKSSIGEYLLTNPPSSKKAQSPAPSAVSDGPPSTPTSDASFDIRVAVYKCSLCDFESEDIGLTQLHSRDVHKGLGRAIDLRKEQPAPKLYKCSFCGQRSNWKADLRKHIRTKHGEGNAEVVSCIDNEVTPVKMRRSTPEKTSKHPSSVILREESSWPFVCSQCGFKSCQKADVSKHIEDVHANDDTNAHVSLQSQFDKDMRPFKCPLCTRRSRWHWDLKKHMRNVHLDCNLEPLCQQYKCSRCDYVSKWHTDIATHLDTEHKGAGEVKVVMEDRNDAREVVKSELTSPPVTVKSTKSGKEDDDVYKVWKCVVCGYTASEKPDAMRHLIKSHPDNKFPYACSLCGHQFNFLSATYRHLRSKHGKNDYSLCKKNLVYVDSDEVIVYSLPKPENKNEEVLCKLCGLLSSSKQHMYQHLRVKHSKRDSATFNSFISTNPSSNNNMDKAIDHVKAPGRAARLPLRYQCDICPYQTNKISMFKMHQSHHKFSAGNSYKCKFCNYYVCAQRLLHQHIRLHLTHDNHEVSIPSKTVANQHVSQQLQVSQLRCLKCPYVAQSKKNLMYHKQFHRPKSTAPFKCGSCDYWVSMQHLLKSHSVVHEPDYLSPQTKSNNVNGDTIPPSPAKSNGSSSAVSIDPSAVETAALKQHLIQSKIKGVVLRTSNSPSPPPLTEESMEMGEDDFEETDAVGGIVFPNQEEYITNGAHGNGAERTNGVTPTANDGVPSDEEEPRRTSVVVPIHRCQYCPYGNPRAVNVRMHEEMHGKSGEHRIKCQECDYYCGNMGLMSHHVKVHSPGYNPQFLYSMKALGKEPKAKASPSVNEVVKTLSELTAESGFQVGYNEKTKRHTLQVSNVKKYCCEKCPYAALKRDKYERHILLHCSKQKYTCAYCDYSVPSYNLLVQHKRLHLKPNHNLLAVQSINNLQELPTVTADVAITSGLSADTHGKPVANTHDNLELYENTNVMDNSGKPKKLYRCDRCPFTNVSREHLLTHLKSHIIRNEFECPYCDYSVGKVQLLSQHVNVHFNNQLLDSDADLPTALNASEAEIGEMKKGEPEFIDLHEYSKVLKVNAGPTNLNPEKEKDPKPPAILSSPPDAAKAAGLTEGETVWICQFCDRAFHASENLIKHEMQHLLGNKLYVNKRN